MSKSKAEKELSCSEVQRKISCKDFVTKPENKKAAVWNSFNRVYDTTNQKCRWLGYVQCNKCYQVLTHPKGDGTGHLARHQDSCKSGKSMDFIQIVE